jgi:hypothetical protein
MADGTVWGAGNPAGLAADGYAQNVDVFNPMCKVGAGHAGTLCTGVDQLSGATAIGMGDTNTGAALLTNGNVAVWGQNNSAGDLGEDCATAYTKTVPVYVFATATGCGVGTSLTNVTAMSFGGGHGILRTSDGTLYAWGNGDETSPANGNALGNGSASPTPTAVLPRLVCAPDATPPCATSYQVPITTQLSAGSNMSYFILPTFPNALSGPEIVG